MLKSTQVSTAIHFLCSLSVPAVWKACWGRTARRRQVGGRGGTHLQRDHGDLAFAVAARGLSVFTGLVHVVTQVSPQDPFFAVGTNARQFFKLAIILQMHL